MKTVIKVYKGGCSPCEQAQLVIDKSKEDQEFAFESYNIESSKFIERRTGKSYLMQFATTNIPLLLFKNEEGEIYAAHYYEEGAITEEIIKQKLNGN